MSAETVNKILVVDDELETRIFLSNLLKANGFHPVTASNKVEALKKAVSLSPSIIILNMMMPGENGIRLYQSLKQDNSLRRIPVIMLSTLDKDTFLKCHNLYGYRQCEAYERNDKFMEKPVQAEDLLASVQGLCVPGHAQQRRP
ncbi:MAG: response regulator [Deltaproteobacteria bacterium]|nr:response regulator [Deltaproteobacteria bacterium]